MRVFLTGASSGLGYALARYYAARGAILGLAARRVIDTRAIPSSNAQEHCIYALDVRDAEALRRAAADFIDRRGCPDVVIANAGISVGTSTERAEDLNVLQEVIDINLIGMANTFQPFIDCMRQARAGSLVGIGSVAAYRGVPGAAAYSASKAAALTYLESMRVELRGSGIRVTSVSPGYIDTPMTEKNPYRMPFILDSNEAARMVVRAIEQRRRYVVIPWQMAIIARALRVLPDALYDIMFAHGPRKPRRDER